MKKLLVVGDSFMAPDLRFSGQHWSEMLPEYEILMRSQGGATNGMIAYEFFEGLELKPDAVVMGFTMPDRIEFKTTDFISTNKKWYSSKHDGHMSADEKLAVDYYQATTCQEMMIFKSFLIVRCLLLTCEKQKIPYAFTLNGLWDSRNKCSIDEPWKTICKNEITLLGEFAKYQTPTTFIGYPNWKAIPSFHVDDPVWQQRFAQEAREILQQPVDNTIQIV
jgi:hypothetical protein